MPEEILLSQFEDHVLTVTLNRPEARNALSPGLMRGLLDTLSEAAEDARVRCVLLQGNGKDFCVGGDIAAARNANEKPEMSAEEIAAAEERAAKRGPISPDLMTKWLRRNSRVVELLHTMPKPTVVNLKGNVVGAGIGLALASDFRVVADNTKLKGGFSAVGYSGDFGSGYFLTSMMGAGKAREVLMLNRSVTGQELADLGLATEFVSAEKGDETAMKLARELAQLPPIALSYMKQNIKCALTSSLSDYLDLESINQNRCSQTEDSKEAIKAFFEKRPPTFQGK